MTNGRLTPPSELWQFVLFKNIPIMIFTILRDSDRAAATCAAPFSKDEYVSQSETAGSHWRRQHIESAVIPCPLLSG